MCQKNQCHTKKFYNGPAIKFCTDITPFYHFETLTHLPEHRVGRKLEPGGKPRVQLQEDALQSRASSLDTSREWIKEMWPVDCMNFVL